MLTPASPQVFAFLCVLAENVLDELIDDGKRQPIDFEGKEYERSYMKHLASIEKFIEEDKAKFDEIALKVAQTAFARVAGYRTRRVHNLDGFDDCH
ncbi:hypothetical protein DL93DRAFT_1220918 [Clavulina sp. PMI_390]|nr:hypothetical protein DL93DRAFT_1220918 [Clavulina sp. PMI_390]